MFRYALEQEIEQLLKMNPELRRLQQERRERDVQSVLSDDKPLEEVLERILSASPTLRTLFLQGRRLSRPFAGGAGGGNGTEDGVREGDKNFKGRRHPTYFKIPDVAEGALYRRHCEDGRRCRIAFETDVENDYFDRATDRGKFQFDVVDSSRSVSPPSFSLALEDGLAHLNMALPPEAEIGDELVLQASVQDPTLVEPLISMIKITVDAKQDHAVSTSKQSKKQHGGDGDGASQQGIKLPTPIVVHENDDNWRRHHFNPATACHVISDPVEVNGTTALDHTFYINVDNTSLKTEMKYSKQNPGLLEAKFKYANVLLGLAMLHDAEKSGRLQGGEGHSTSTANDGGNGERETVQDAIRHVSSAIAPVLLPIIDQLSGLTEEQTEEISASGEDI